MHAGKSADIHVGMHSSNSWCAWADTWQVATCECTWGREKLGPAQESVHNPPIVWWWEGAGGQGGGGRVGFYRCREPNREARQLGEGYVDQHAALTRTLTVEELVKLTTLLLVSVMNSTHMPNDVSIRKSTDNGIGR